ncbi:MAG TPA: DUF1592 domain-containing protein [Candidatus Limnocylindria bacterium]|nr:DUF1592 domain-containing protein [Candidatus Limnocylindria bacterium]
MTNALPRTLRTLLLSVPWWLPAVLGAESEAGGSVVFEREVKPLLAEYCLKCHSTEKHKGDLDLEPFTSLEAVRKHPKIWQGVVEQVSTGELPPKDKPQPTAPQRERLLSWVNAALDDIARAHDGDPGPVVLRRLSNAEYTYTVRDLTGVESLDPVREFPVDGASGEGFMNVGNSLVMSPSLLTKYLDAGKRVASHAMLLPEGIRFSPKASRQDWTDDLLAEIRGFYRQYTDPRGGDKVNLQGIIFETNEGGRVPLEKYLTATLELREALRRAPKAGGEEARRKAREAAIASVSAAHGLSPKYLGILWAALTSTEPSLLLDPLRTRWKVATTNDVAALATGIADWQKALWKFSTVGHIGKAGGPKAWMEPVSPLAAKQEVRLKLPVPPEGRDISLYLVASDAGDGSDHDFVVWDQPRFVAPGRPDLLLRDVRAVSDELTERRARMFSTTAKALDAAAELEASATGGDVAASAHQHGVVADDLTAWLTYLGIGATEPVAIKGYFTTKLTKVTDRDFVNGWGSSDTPLLLANASDQNLRIPQNVKAHGIVVHPSPTLDAVVGWRSPVTATVRIAAKVQHAHPECGNGVTWSLELRRGANRQRLAAGISEGGRLVNVGPFENVAVRPGDLISVVIGPRDANHSCDTTAVDLVLTTIGGDGREWDLSQDVSPDVLAGNPHADRFGTANIWHFYTEPDKGGPEFGPVVPPGSLLAQWRTAAGAEVKRKLAAAVQQLLLSGGTGLAKDSPDAALYRQLVSLGGPLLGTVPRTPALATAKPAKAVEPTKASKHKKTGSNGGMPAEPALPGLDPGLFGKNAGGQPIDAASLAMRAPSAVEIELPADLVAGYEFVTTGRLDTQAGAEGSVQLQVLTAKPAGTSSLVASVATKQVGKGVWTDPDKPVSYAAPIVVNDGSAARKRIEAALDGFRQLFPAALCYTKIVPVDEAVTLTLYYREDDQLARLMLNDAEQSKLNRLWDELHFVSQDAFALVDAFEQLWQFATQDADPKVFEPLREPIKQRAAAFRVALTNAQPRHLEAVLEFADRAYRHALSDSEKDELHGLYGTLREEGLPHDEAIRLLLARVLVAPAFLYHAEKPGPGLEQVPISDDELASRLSYFLWSSEPDAELRALAAQGRLHDPAVLAAQTRRLLRAPQVRRLATEFACAWLHIYDFDQLSEKSERHFPTFAALRGDMYEESIRFFTDFFQSDRPVPGILNADYVFVNEPLAKHYGITGVKFAGSNDWQRVDGVKQFSRGGILAQATTLSKQSGASRTSPILRGNWLSEVILGEKLPRPPKDVPRLPEDEATETLTVRQLTEKHSSDPRCATCHIRIDGFGFSLEGFDAIGRHRDRDLGDRPIDTHGKTMDGAQFEGLDGLRDYLLTKRRDAFEKQFCRKLLGYALGRSVQLSDGPLITEMRAQLRANGYRVGAVVETIVKSRQFREIRGKEMAMEE